MQDEVKVAQETQENAVADSQNQLVTLDSDKLTAESRKLLNEIIAVEAGNIEKTKDLTYLFNINQNKKTMVRMEKLNDLQDDLVSQFQKRIAAKPDEISNQELMTAMKIVQDILERSQKQIVGVEQPLIQINQQTNSVNVGDADTANLTKESRDKIANAVASVLNSITATTNKPEQPIDADFTVNKGEPSND